MLNFDTLYNPYASRRVTTYANNGMVATSQPLAAEAGLSVLRKGGNAVDAAIAAAVCLTVVEPTSNGIGGDAFALIWSKGELYGLNASGPAPQLLNLQILKKAGREKMPIYGWLPVTVPGAPSAWAELSSRFGRLPLTEVMAPAIKYAEGGFPVSPTVGRSWEISFDRYAHDLKDEQYKSWFNTFAPDGRAPKIGELWRSPDHARTLQSIAETKASSFYSGVIADKIDYFSKHHGGFLRKEDLAAYKPEWVNPVSINYRGYQVWEIPPNGHGLVALLALNILKGFDFDIKESTESYHYQIEAMKLAFADGLKYIADPSQMSVSINDLLSDEYAAERRKLIGGRALQPEPGRPPKGGTVYLATADSEGNMVSYIQSNYMGFGSGLVVPGTGISLHNRGNNFSLDPNHANCLQPGKKPYHTIIPGFLTKDQKPVGPFGVMGGFMQPQGHVQVIMNTLDFHLNPQAALDAPRWQWINGKTIGVEHSFPEHIAQVLARKGHDINWSMDTASFGRGQIIWRTEDDVLAGGTESRADGYIGMW
ncbi:gamma-glutamyltransferase [Desulfosporosinus orientis DSM 765]|uniref:Gamma-glutamyltransferase n=1 Tax=Desulfosporosinus orientis (strain ATCC 19365 / DSM 765 / NCIMB 8382 / VKM B-1628 / Singapore I) TaxID=768706 RepID=G7WGZ2_DESOD|nr:gamma-glutamyltransferase family protein [Desulfosporosinus orientis]AET69006.1 gamma-glutamyltransferase [Desulfosporosinus orientis DSM 765]